ncbi:DNA-binding protein [Clostridium sp. BJN0013]|uniref:DNA-binding protein n=1 Tax=Clostridium sp. BJN0013 TaxID=3236840 RepID=UPI0034C6677E
MEYLTVKEAGEKWAITGWMVTYYCVDRRIKGTIKKGNLWLVPADAEKPVDGRYKKNKAKEMATAYEHYPTD